MSERLVFRTKCHPEANGRTPKRGDVEHALVFPLENGESLTIHMGKEGFERFSQFLLDEMANTPSYGDDSVDWNEH